MRRGMLGSKSVYPQPIFLSMLPTRREIANMELVRLPRRYVTISAILLLAIYLYLRWAIAISKLTICRELLIYPTTRADELRDHRRVVPKSPGLGRGLRYRYDSAGGVFCFSATCIFRFGFAARNKRRGSIGARG